MRIISLNTWGGRAGRGLISSFFKKYGDTTDVFCLQEMWSAAYENLEGKNAGGVPMRYEDIMVTGVRDISAILPNHKSFFRPHLLDNYGLFMLVNKNLPLIEEGEVFVHKQKGYIPEGDAGNHARNIQYITVSTEAGPITVINFHGLWTNVGEGKGKRDNKDRLEQSEKILEFTTRLKNQFVLCGDFNLLPDTESIKKFEKAGLRNLIREFGITSTRTSFYTKPVKFADYAFLSKELDLKNFRVLPDEVSDHAPLYIEVSL